MAESNLLPSRRVEPGGRRFHCGCALKTRLPAPGQEGSEAGSGRRCVRVRQAPRRLSSRERASGGGEAHRGPSLADLTQHEAPLWPKDAAEAPETVRGWAPSLVSAGHEHRASG